MSRTYLKKDSVVKTYHYKTSYLDFEEKIFQPRKYLTLPEEYDIFSELDFNTISKTNKKQRELLNAFLFELKKQLQYLASSQGIIRILPKLSMSIDSDDAIVLNLAYTNYRFFVNIECNTMDSFYGIIAQDDEKTLFSKSGDFNNNNYNLIISKILDFIFNQT